MKIKYMGFEIVQSKYNNHIFIFDHNNLIMHIETEEKFTKEELENLVRFYLIMKENI